MRIMAVVALVGAGIGAAWGQNAPQPGGSPVRGVSIDSTSGARLPLLTRADMRDDESARIYDALSGPVREPPRGAVGIALYSPATAAGFSRVERYLLTGSALRGRLAALLTLVTAREMNLAYEWSVREAAARSLSLEATVIEAIRSNGSIEGLSGADALLIDFGRQLFRNRHVQSTTFAAIVNRLGRQGTFDAIMLLTYPAMAGVLERAVDQQPPQGWSGARLPRIAGVSTPTGRPGEFVALPERPPLPNDVHEDSYYRFPLLARQDLDARSKDIFDRVVGPDRETTPRGPVGMTFLSAELVEPVQEINTALRTNGVLGTRLAEIVIATTGREMNSQYQWTVHGAAAAAAGAGQGVLDAIRSDGPVTALDERDAVAIDFTRQIFREETVRPETFARAVQLFGVRGTVEIAALIGDYLMVTTMYNALGMRLRAEQAATLPHRAGAPLGAEWR